MNFVRRRSREIRSIRLLMARQMFSRRLPFLICTIRIVRRPRAIVASIATGAISHSYRSVQGEGGSFGGRRVALLIGDGDIANFGCSDTGGAEEISGCKVVSVGADKSRFRACEFANPFRSVC